MNILKASCAGTHVMFKGHQILAAGDVRDKPLGHFACRAACFKWRLACHKRERRVPAKPASSARFRNRRRTTKRLVKGFHRRDSCLLKLGE